MCVQSEETKTRLDAMFARTAFELGEAPPGSSPSARLKAVSQKARKAKPKPSAMEVEVSSRSGKTVSKRNLSEKLMMAFVAPRRVTRLGGNAAEG